jgi:uncharacterized membrane protein YdjX (TVP38/TMEM64 family)
MAQLVAAFIVVMAPSVAYAYIGPGAGITAIGSLIALVGAVMLAIVGFLWFPIKRIMRARAARSEAARESRTSDSARG